MAGTLIDQFGRRIDYVRLSVTDRCDLRCRYCMSEKMQFLPRNELLSLEELHMLSFILIARGVRRIRLTGGEPLVRRGILSLIEALGQHIGNGLDELTLTTNGTQLTDCATALYQSGVRRLNVSLDSLDPEKFRHITRTGDLSKVLAGIGHARGVGLKIKINMVVLNGQNTDDVIPMLRWCAAHGHELSLIETMPLGEIDDNRASQFIGLNLMRERIEAAHPLIPSTYKTGGPARYFDVPDIGGRIGFITPHSNNFCASCNRIRITATGTIYGCLGKSQNVQLRDAMRTGGTEAVHEAIDKVLASKPRRHDFDIAAPRPALGRHMSVTGG